MKPYVHKQSTIHTCGAASVMSILKHFRKLDELTEDKELEIWRELVELPFTSSSVLGMAVFLKESGLDVELIQKQVAEVDLKHIEFNFCYCGTPKYKKECNFECRKIDHRHFLKLARDSKVTVRDRDPIEEDLKLTSKEAAIILLDCNRIYEAVHGESDEHSAHYVVAFKRDLGRVTIGDPNTGEITEILVSVLLKAMDDVRNIYFPPAIIKVR